MPRAEKVPEEIRKNLKSWMDDPIEFIENQIKVVHPMRGLVAFQLYPFQKRIVNCLNTRRFNILRKFRQAGCTTIVAAYALWMIVFRPNATVAIISKDDEAAKEVLERIKIAYDELHPFIKKHIASKKYRSSHKLVLSNGSKVLAKAPSKEAGRSLSANLLILDEAAFIEHIETIYSAAYPTLSTGGSCFVLSTVNGIGNWYYHIWKDAERGLNEYHPIEIKWQDHPEYKKQEGYEDLYEMMEKRWSPPINVDEWENITKKNIGPKKWLQEYECEFLGTGDTYVDSEILRYLRLNVKEDYYIKYNNRMRVWEDPNPNYEYLISVDTALGGGRNNSAFHIINLYNGKQVAEFYSNKTSINEFAAIINEVGLEYNLALIVPERNTIGTNLIERLFGDLEYENIYMDEKGLFGVQTSSSTREQMLAEMEECIRLNKFKISSQRTIEELLTFIVNENGKAEADVDCYDDLVMSLAIAAYVFKEITGGVLLESDGKEELNKLVPPRVGTKYKVNSYGGMIEENILEWLMDKKMGA